MASYLAALKMHVAMNGGQIQMTCTPTNAKQPRPFDRISGAIKERETKTEAERSNMFRYVPSVERADGHNCDFIRTGGREGNTDRDTQSQTNQQTNDTNNNRHTNQHPIDTFSNIADNKSQ